MQQQILEEIVKSVILAGGCEDVGALEEDPFGYFNNEEIQEQVEEYLGPKNSITFVGLIAANNTTVKKVAKNIAGLVPLHQVCKQHTCNRNTAGDSLYVSSLV